MIEGPGGLVGVALEQALSHVAVPQVYYLEPHRHAQALRAQICHGQDATLATQKMVGEECCSLKLQADPPAPVIATC